MDIENNTMFFFGKSLTIALQRRLYDEKSMVFESVENFFICKYKPFHICCTQ